MSLALSDYQLRFKKFGKFIYEGQVASPWVSILKTAHATTVDQTSQTNQSTEFDVNDQVLSPLGTTIKSVATTLATVPVATFTAADSFLRKFIAVVDLGLAANASTATIGTALSAGMTSAGATVAPSGTNGANASGIAMYFANNWGIVLPQNSSPTIPDSYITATIL